MPARKKKDQLGRALARDRRAKTSKSFKPGSFLHTSELEDGHEWARLNPQSITEQSDVENFLLTAELAGTEFIAERLNAKIVADRDTQGILTKAEKEEIKKAQELNKDSLRIPRRPRWNRAMDAAELAELERASFLEWRRALAVLQEKRGITMTPYEKNLDFWRQLWRVIERSDVVVQIVDARNPLLFRCEDLELYVKEVHSSKRNLLLVNKADLLTQPQMEYWSKHFESQGMEAVFFSATQDTKLENIQEEDEENVPSDPALLHNENQPGLSYDDIVSKPDINLDEIIEECQIDLEHLKMTQTSNASSSKLKSNSITFNTDSQILSYNQITSKFINQPVLLNREELELLFASFHTPFCHSEKHVTIGLVGYPNVGKSSTINSLFTQKKVSVSATPGKTKHFQTLYLSDIILLCDCPGLVFPAFVTTKEEMIISGILSIDQMREHIPPINQVLSKIPRQVLEVNYSIKLPTPPEGENVKRKPTAHELLNEYAAMRSFMSHKGQPDTPRAARYILKDYVNGKLLFCHAPPGVSQKEYHKFVIKVKKTVKTETPSTPTISAPTLNSNIKSNFEQKTIAQALDDQFFNSLNTGAHVQGKNPRFNSPMKPQFDEKTGKRLKMPKPEKARKEKLRKKFAYLDQ